MSHLWVDPASGTKIALDIAEGEMFFKEKSEEELRADLRAMQRDARRAKAEDAFDYLSGCGELTLGKLMAAAELSTDGFSRFEVETVWNRPNRSRQDLERFRSEWLAKLGHAIRSSSRRAG